LEIGCRWGGTFILMSEYLRLINGSNVKAVAVDIIRPEISMPSLAVWHMPHIVIDYCEGQENSSFLQLSSTSEAYRLFIADKKFDMILATTPMRE